MPLHVQDIHFVFFSGEKTKVCWKRETWSHREYEIGLTKPGLVCERTSSPSSVVALLFSC